MQRNSFLTSLPFCCENGNFSLDLIKKNNATQKRGDDGDNPTIVFINKTQKRRKRNPLSI